MGFFRFRRSIKLFPGIRWNFGEKSTSLSICPRGALYTMVHQEAEPRLLFPEQEIQEQTLDPSNLSEDKCSMTNNVKGKALNKPWGPLQKLKKEGECLRTHVSLFSGCGGIDLGLRQAGFRTVFANDINPDACATYRANLGEISEQDIREVHLPKLAKRLDLLTAGMPCQPFSNAGSRKGTDDHRGTLYQSAIHAIEEYRPRAVILENVRGFLSFHEGDKLLIEEVCAQLYALGYNVAFSLVDASKHHVPQRRLRLFIVGVERKKGMSYFHFPKPEERTDLTLRHTIFDIGDDTANQGDIMQLNPQAIQIGSMVPEGGSWKSIPYKDLPPRLKKISDNIARYRWPNFYRRFHRDEVAGTITAAFKPENAGVWHPAKGRIFSVREIARIQSFPDWFHFEGRNVKSRYQQIGNAVPPRLAFELGCAVNNALDGLTKTPPEYPPHSEILRRGKPVRASDGGIKYAP